MRVLACILLTAAGYFFSLGIGDLWWLAWLAPIPILWLAFGPTRAAVVFAAAWLAMALGLSSYLRAYGQLFAPGLLALMMLGPSALFAAAVLGARRALHRLGPVAAMLAFAALWAGFDLLASFGRGGGNVMTPAAAEMAAPALVQGAALVGFTGITFLLGLVPAGIAAGWRSGARLPFLIAGLAFAANAGFGALRLAGAPGGGLHVALIESDAATGKLREDDRAAAFAALDAYIHEIDTLSPGAGLIVLPENIARIAPPWRAEFEAKLGAAAERHHATVVAGFNMALDGARRNVSWAFTPGQPAEIYQKRRLVPHLESEVYTPGARPVALASGIGLEICKDMDFQSMIRRDAIATRPRLLAVPAWDFDQDGWSHARVAILRSVENGVPMARTARNGLLTLNDRYGRLVASARSAGAFQVLQGDLPLGERGGGTLYDRIGDLFGWLSLLLGAALALAPYGRGARQAERLASASAEEPPNHARL